MTLADLPTAIYFLIILGVVVFTAMAKTLIGDFSSLRTGEKVMIVFGGLGLVVTILYATLQLVFNFLI